MYQSLNTANQGRLGELYSEKLWDQFKREIWKLILFLHWEKTSEFSFVFL